jgi:hypothetical protein
MEGSYDQFNMKISSIIQVERLSNGSWPFMDKILNKYKSLSGLTNVSMVSYFTNPDAALTHAKNLIGRVRSYDAADKVSSLKFKSITETPSNQQNSSGRKGDFWNN